MCCRLFLRLAILSALALMLGGCARSLGKLDVDLQALKECQKLKGPVSVPEIGENSDYRILSAEALGQLKKANSKDSARTRCEQKVIDQYAKAQ
jgi:hypothetical protein